MQTTLCNWNSNTSEMKYWQLASMTLLDLDKEKERWTKRKSYDLSISCVVGAFLQLFTPLSTQSLGMVCANFFCLTLSKTNEAVCQYVCCRVTHVEADQHTECINTSAVCLQEFLRAHLHCTLHKSSRSCHLYSEWSFRALKLLIFQKLLCLLT